jgi:hypothetical protein
MRPDRIDVQCSTPRAGLVALENHACGIKLSVRHVYLPPHAFLPPIEVPHVSETFRCARRRARHNLRTAITSVKYRPCLRLPVIIRGGVSHPNEWVDASAWRLHH